MSGFLGLNSYLHFSKSILRFVRICKAFAPESSYLANTFSFSGVALQLTTVPKENSNIDPSLLTAFRNGSTDAFQQIFELHYRQILFFAERMLKDKMQAEDMVSDSFLKVWERRDKIANSHALIAYLQVVTRNACIDQIKKNKRQASALRELRISQPLSDEEINAELLRAELLNRSWQFAQILPASTKKVFDLHFGEGLSIREIAGQLGTSINTVKAQRRSALQKIKNLAMRKGWLFIIPLMVGSQ
jgi:RNA polymerase sigma-70 factor (ECF subfamily)